MQTLILDSSQISAHEECPQEWANRGLVQVDFAKVGEAMAAGTLGHKYLEIYYTVLCESDGGMKLAAETALAFDPDAADEVDSQFPLDLALRAKVKQRFCDYLFNYPADRDYKPAFKKVHGIAVKDGKLIDVVKRDPLIEKGFSYKLFESKEYLFVLEGRIDFMGEATDGSVLWLDHKFQFRAHQLYEKSIQFRNYSLATGLNLAVINYIRLHDKLDKTTFVRQPLSFSSLEMLHWKEELIDIYVRIAKEVASGNFPKNRNSCGGGWGRPCQYTPLCNEYHPEIRAAIQRRDFTTRREWRPWE